MLADVKQVGAELNELLFREGITSRVRDKFMATYTDGKGFSETCKIEVKLIFANTAIRPDIKFLFFDI